jgi:hypothetical protein
MEKFKLREDIRFSKVLTSNLLLSLSLIKTNKSTPDSLVDFITGLSMIDQNAYFSKETLSKVFKDKFPRLFIQTTFKTQKITPFDYFFQHLQSNYINKDGLIKKLNNNRFCANNILPNLSITSPHLSLYKVKVGYKEIESYKGNMSKLSKDCSFASIENICNKYKDVVFTYPLIKQIFGLSKQDVKNYLKDTAKIEYVYRTIGKQECDDLELDYNLFTHKKKFKIIRGFKINFFSKFEHNLSISFSDFALKTIKTRLEKEQYRFNQTNFFTLLNTTNRPILNNNECQFNEQYERLGFNCVSSAHSRYRLKKYIESVNLGSFKQMKNIYSYLKNNFDKDYFEKGIDFKHSYKSLLKRFIYQY